MDLWSSSKCVKKTLRKKGSGEEIGMAFVRVEEVKTRLEDLAWAEDDGETLHRGASALELTSSNAMKSPSVLVKGLSFQEAAVSGRSKGQGKSGVKRHLKVLKGDFQGISERNSLSLSQMSPEPSTWMLLGLTSYMYSPTSEEKKTLKEAGIKLNLFGTGTGYMVFTGGSRRGCCLLIGWPKTWSASVQYPSRTPSSLVKTQKDILYISQSLLLLFP